jgi:hypothetical protein
MASKRELVSVCRKRHWSGYSKYSKSDLIKFVNNKYSVEINAVNKLQTWWKSLLSKRLSCKQVNADDVFTLEKVTVDSNFYLYDYMNNTKHLFNPCSLIEYMFNTGKFANPYNRKLLSSDNFHRLFIYYLKHPSKIIVTYTIDNIIQPLDRALLKCLTILRKIVEHHKVEEQQQQEQLGYLDEECVNIIRKILHIIADIPADDGETIISVIRLTMTHYIPELVESFTDLYRLSETRATELSEEYINACMDARTTVGYINDQLSSVQEILLSTIINKIRQEFHMIFYDRIPVTRIIPLLIY